MDRVHTQASLRPSGSPSFLASPLSPRTHDASLAQLLGYCRIVRPEAAWLVSPKGWAGSLAKLIRDFGRTDLLEFAPGKKIIVGRWDEASAQVRPGDTL